MHVKQLLPDVETVITPYGNRVRFRKLNMGVMVHVGDIATAFKIHIDWVKVKLACYSFSPIVFFAGKPNGATKQAISPADISRFVKAHRGIRNFTERDEGLINWCNTYFSQFPSASIEEQEVPIATVAHTHFYKEGNVIVAEHPLYGSVRIISHNNQIYYDVRDISSILHVKGYKLYLSGEVVYRSVEGKVQERPFISKCQVDEFINNSHVDNSEIISSWLDNEFITTLHAHIPQEYIYTFNLSPKDIECFCDTVDYSIATEIRVAGDDKEPLFCAADVAKAINIVNPRQAIATLDEDDVRKIDTTDKLNRHQSTNFLTESGLYTLIIRSSRPEAKQFRKWITSEVLPSIRRTGGYMIAKPNESNEELLSRAMLVAQDTINRLNSECHKLIEDNNHQTKVIEGLTEHITLADKRQRLIQIMRKAGPRTSWKLLYKEFDSKYHIHVATRVKHNGTSSRLDYIEHELNMIHQLFELACKLFEGPTEAVLKAILGPIELSKQHSDESNDNTTDNEDYSL
jgi:prophage antirepressor-like protein